MGTKDSWTLKNFLAVLFSMVWAIDAVAGIIRGSGPSPIIAGPVTIILGSIFGHSLLKNRASQKPKYTVEDLEAKLRERLEE